MIVYTWALVAVAGALADAPRVFEGHSGVITAVAFSADGQWLASGGTDREIRVWNVADGKTKTVLKGLSQAPEVLVFSRDGAHLASGDIGLELKLWNLKTGEAAATWLHESTISDVVFSADGKTLLVAGPSDNGAVYSVPDGKKVKELAARSVRVLADGQSLLVGSRRGRIELWPGKKGEAKRTLSTPKHVPSVAVSGDGQVVLSRSPAENAIFVWDLKTKKEAGRLVGHVKGVTSLAVSADGSRAVSASLDGSVKLWDVKARKLLETSQGQGSVFVAANPAFSAVAAGEGRYLKLWELP